MVPIPPIKGTRNNHWLWVGWRDREGATEIRPKTRKTRQLMEQPSIASISSLASGASHQGEFQHLEWIEAVCLCQVETKVSGA